MQPLRPARPRSRPRAGPAAAPAPARLRLHAGGPQGPAGADRGEGRGADRLDGQRPLAGRAERQPPAALLLLQAALRAGHEPADRPDPRGDRDERHDRRRLRAQPARRDARARAPARDGHADPAQPRAREAAPGRLRDLLRAHARHHVADRRRRRRPGEGARPPVRRGRRGAGRGRQRADPVRPRGRPRARRHARAARRRRRPPPPRARGHAPAGRPRARVRRAARGPSLRHADRLRRQRHQPVRDVRLARRARARRQGGRRRRRRDRREERRQGHRQGPAQDDLQDGDLDDPVLQRGADLRGRRPGERPDRPLLRGHRVADRGRRARRAGARDARQARARVPARARGHPARGRHLRLAPRRRAPHVEPGDDRAAPARGPPRRPPDLRGVLAARQRRRRPPRHAARPAPVQAAARGRVAAARGDRAGQGDRPALQHRRDVARLAVARGARDAGDRHEPPRRPLEHRRGRRGPGPLLARQERRLAALGDQAGRVRPLRREHQLPRQRRRAADQDGPGRQARRGRPAARPQGRPLHRLDPLHHAGRGPDLAAAAPRHLLDRGPQAAHLRPALLEPGRAREREAGLRGRASARSPRASRRRTPTTC